MYCDDIIHEIHEMTCWDGIELMGFTCRGGIELTRIRARVEPRRLHVLAILLAAVAVVCMVVAIVGMVTGRPGVRAGGWIRAAAVACFAAAVVVNVLAH